MSEPKGELVVLSKQEYDRLIEAAAATLAVEELFKDWKAPGRTYIQSEIDTQNTATFKDSCAGWREHKYVGGPPSKRLRAMQSNHEVRARRFGVPWDMVDLRKVYRHHKGVCGICHEAVGVDVFTIDHIIPLARGGPHLFDNLQLAHAVCNSRKGDS